MQRSSPGELSPGARYVAGPTFAHFCASPELWGIVLWGRPSHEDVVALRRSLLEEIAADTLPHVSVVDASRMTGVDMAAFEELRSYVEENAEALARGVTRLALVRPDGLPGAVVAGMFAVMPQPYPVRVFASLTPALGWLSEHEEELSCEGLARVLDDVVAECADAAPIVTALATYFASHLTNANVGDAARALHLSLRTLQRRLSEAETTFQEQLGLARLAEAQRLMLDSEEPLTTIAMEVGCASLQHFSALFRRHTGESPSAWRESHKRAT
ncbi:MAG: helix-turn-helix transcriptional regulator [Myxococcales bacterium]|nr:helix-turn-helix transcriptional regulator [Myxococcales bacterium]MCB9582858.1 helix-turn-helix transcriptional regulator [Polyangiaceae bacterium]